MQESQRTMIVLRPRGDASVPERRGALATRGAAIASALRAGLVATWIGVTAVAAGCAEKRALGPPPSESTARPSAPPALAASATTAGAAPSASGGAPIEAPRDWIAAVRLERWGEAAAKIDALLQVERDRPEIKYARARAALALGDHARARDLLAGLDDALPDIAGDVRRHRAEACAVAGPYPEAAAFFAKSARPRDIARAAEVFERAGDLASARTTAERAVTLAQKSRSRSAEAYARTVRARLAQGGPKGAAAQADLRWIAFHAPETPEGRAAQGTLDELGVKPTAKEVIAQVEALLDAARGDEAVAVLEGPRGALLPARDRLHLHGMALYKARRHVDAAAALEKAAKGGTGREAEEMHYAARALARAGRDADAIKKHREVARRYRSTPWGDRSAFLVAQLLAQTGKFKDATQAFTAYLGAFPRGERKDDAEYERALAQLSGDGPLAARPIFAKLADGAKPDEAARLTELEGVAALRGGQREIAIRLWNKVVRSAPLSWASVMARARLAQVGEPPTPFMSPAPAGDGAPVDGPLPKPAALLASIGLDGDAESWLLANEQVAAAAYPGRESEALCSMYGKLARAKRRYRVGSAAVAYTTLMRTPSPSERWTWECVYPTPYPEHVRKTEDERGLPFGLLHAVMRQESAFDPVIASPAGAVGLLQIIPPTAQAIAREIEPGGAGPGELSSPDVSVRYGGYYLSRLLAMFQGSVPLAAASYNAGPRIVSHWLEVGGDLDADVWVARIPYEETRNYVARVTGNLLRYQWLAGGNDKVVAIPLKLPGDARAPADAY